MHFFIMRLCDNKFIFVNFFYSKVLNWIYLNLKHKDTKKNYIKGNKKKYSFKRYYTYIIMFESYYVFYWICEKKNVEILTDICFKL